MDPILPSINGDFIVFILRDVLKLGTGISYLSPQKLICRDIEIDKSCYDSDSNLILILM